ncbi:hypothetical protein VR010_13590 [Actinomycetaceae bacterium L2_0104]
MEPLNIVAVCTGNICRSPLSEYFLRNALNPEHFSISSGGTRAVRGGEVPEQQAKIARQLGLDAIVEHKPHQITANEIRDADLVLTATLRHRRRIVRMLPSASSRVFTMREYAHLAPHVREADLIELLAQGTEPLKTVAVAVHQIRGTVPAPSNSEDYDIVDPFGEDKKTYRIAADQLVTAHRAIVDFLQRVERLASQLTAARQEAEPQLSPRPASDPAPSPNALPSAPATAPRNSETESSPSQTSPSPQHDVPHSPSVSNQTSMNTPAPIGQIVRTRPGIDPDTFEFPAFQGDGPPTHGKGIQLGLDEATVSQRSGKHTFNPKNPDHANNRRRIMSTSRDLPVPKADRGKHRRYPK